MICPADPNIRIIRAEQHPCAGPISIVTAINESGRIVAAIAVADTTGQPLCGWLFSGLPGCLLSPPQPTCAVRGSSGCHVVGWLQPCCVAVLL
mmetsp:Transcript_458/g.1297  ORF Transcript_458/g.1297 Transcript_458/m.1297 type:complete len:93 (-) Transcript_458:150-428(-)